MSDFTETEHVGFFGNLKNALMGLVFGIILFIASFPVLFINEGHAVRRAQSLEEGQGSVITVQTDKVESANESKLVHMTGDLKTDAKLKDPDFNVGVNAIGLRRTVEMYQWEETVKTKKKDKIGGGTEKVKTYTYNKVWSSSPIDSSSFNQTQHANPAFTMKQGRWKADKVTIGAFNLTDTLINQYNKYETLPVTDDLYQKLPKDIKARFKKQGTGLYASAPTPPPAAPTPPAPPASSTGTNEANPSANTDSTGPQIGDIRVNFTYAKPGPATVMAMQAGNSFSEFPTRGGKSAIEQTLALGSVSSQDLFNQKIQSNKMMTWLRRGLGLAMMFIGVSLLMAPIKALANILPFLGWLVDGVTFIIAGLVTIIFGPLTIGLGWVTYRPLVGIPLMAISLVGIFLLIQNRMKAGKAKQTMPT